MPGSRAISAVNQLLDAFHAAASAADGEAYFATMSADFVFLGTDATERWDKAAFCAYAAARFQTGTGWTYRPLERHVVVHGDVAWFDERLDNERYGEARGSGVAVAADGVWRVAHYVLSFPIPNELATELLARIRAVR